MIKTRRYILAGLLAIIPLWITWLVLRFLFQLLVKAGAPAIQWLASKLPESLKGFLESPLFTNFFSILLVVAVLYGIQDKDNHYKHTADHRKLNHLRIYRIYLFL